MMRRTYIAKMRFRSATTSLLFVAVAGSCFVNGCVKNDTGPSSEAPSQSTAIDAKNSSEKLSDSVQVAKQSLAQSTGPFDPVKDRKVALEILVGKWEGTLGDEIFQTYSYYEMAADGRIHGTLVFMDSISNEYRHVDWSGTWRLEKDTLVQDLDYAAQLEPRVVRAKLLELTSDRMKYVWIEPGEELPPPETDHRTERPHYPPVPYGFVEFHNGEFDESTQAARMANVKKVASAMLFYHANHKYFPTSAILSDEGKALLSWRVLLLPELGYQELFDRFHLDEPWDSAHNLKLVDQIPDEYRRPGFKTGQTAIVAFVGDQTVLREGEVTKKPDDGFSRTLCFVESPAETNRPWTQPADLGDSDQTLQDFIDNIPKDGIIAAFCDSSVYVVPNSVTLPTLKAWLTRNGNEWGAGTSPPED